MRKYQDISKEYRASKATVSMLVVKAKRNPKFISELFDKEILKDRKRDRIEEVINQMDSADTFIDSSRTVIKQIEKDQLDSYEVDRL